MESLIRCAGCGRKPRIKANAQRRGWGHEVASPSGTSKTVLSPPQRGKSSQAYWAYKNAASQQAQGADGGGFTWDATPQHRSIFDKLTDPSLYTGSHKHRFDEEGRGRGLEGRDSVAKGMGTGAVIGYYGDGPVISIAQLVRNEKLDPQHMNKIRRFPDGSSILSPANRSWKGDDSRWRPEIDRGVYPQNNPTYKRTPSSSPRKTPGSAGSHTARLMSHSSSMSLMPPHDVAQLQYAASSSSHVAASRVDLEPYDDTHYHSQPPPQHHYHQPPAAAWSSDQPPPQHPHSYSHSHSHQSSPYAASSSSPSHVPVGSSPHQRPPAAYVPSPIFDKLTDPALYTGTSRERFDEEGRGLGLAGRVDVQPDRYNGDSNMSPVVHDLSQITRTQYNVGSPQGKTGHKYMY